MCILKLSIIISSEGEEIRNLGSDWNSLKQSESEREGEMLMKSDKVEALISRVQGSNKNFK